MGWIFFVYKYQIINIKEIEEEDIGYRVDVVINMPFSMAF